MNDTATAINPFAAPICVSDPVISEDTGNNRASELELRRLCHRLVVADVCFALGCATYFGSYFCLAFAANSEIYVVLSFLPFAFFLVAWVYLINIHQMVQGFVGALGVMITFPIPVLGTCVYRKESVYANLFLYRNGYRRTFLGGESDPEERQLMEADANYVPSSYFDPSSARRRKRSFTLGDATIVSMIGFFIMTMILI